MKLNQSPRQDYENQLKAQSTPEQVEKEIVAEPRITSENPESMPEREKNETEPEPIE